MTDVNPPRTPRKGKIVNLRVTFLDSSLYTFQIPVKAIGIVLWDAVVKHLQLLEADYFDLQFFDEKELKCWLDREKVILKQLPSPDTPLHFCVKFYTPDPALLEEEFTRYQFVLQIKHELCTGQLICSENTAALLASYIVQAEIGDFLEDEYLDFTYLSCLKLAPNQSDDMMKRIMEYHKKHIAQSPAEADINLLDTARKVEMYGIRMQTARDHEDVSLNLAIAHMGILVFQNLTKINTFSWAIVRKLSFKRKKFLIKLHPDSYGYYKDTVEFYFRSRDDCKMFWKKCIEHHAFFRCQTVKRYPRNKTRVVSRGSSFRYSGRTQKELVEYMRQSYLKRPGFERSSSSGRVSCRSTSVTPKISSKSRTLNSSDFHVSQNSTASSGSHVLEPANQDVSMNSVAGKLVEATDVHSESSLSGSRSLGSPKVNHHPAGIVDSPADVAHEAPADWEDQEHVTTVPDSGDELEMDTSRLDPPPPPPPSLSLDTRGASYAFVTNTSSSPTLTSNTFIDQNISQMQVDDNADVDNDKNHDYHFVPHTHSIPDVSAVVQCDNVSANQNANDNATVESRASISNSNQMEDVGSVENYEFKHDIDLQKNDVDDVVAINRVNRHGRKYSNADKLRQIGDKTSSVRDDFERCDDSQMFDSNKNISNGNIDNANVDMLNQANNIERMYSQHAHDDGIVVNGTVNNGTDLIEDIPYLLHRRLIESNNCKSETAFYLANKSIATDSNVQLRAMKSPCSSLGRPARRRPRSEGSPPYTRRQRSLDFQTSPASMLHQSGSKSPREASPVGRIDVISYHSLPPRHSYSSMDDTTSPGENEILSDIIQQQQQQHKQCTSSPERDYENIPQALLHDQTPPVPLHGKPSSSAPGNKTVNIAEAEIHLVSLKTDSDMTNANNSITTRPQTLNTSTKFSTHSLKCSSLEDYHILSPEVSDYHILATSPADTTNTDSNQSTSNILLPPSIESHVFENSMAIDSQLSPAALLLASDKKSDDSDDSSVQSQYEQLALSFSTFRPEQRSPSDDAFSPTEDFQLVDDVLEEVEPIIIKVKNEEKKDRDRKLAAAIVRHVYSMVEKQLSTISEESETSSVAGMSRHSSKDFSSSPLHFPKAENGYLFRDNGSNNSSSYVHQANLDTLSTQEVRKDSITSESDVSIGDLAAEMHFPPERSRKQPSTSKKAGVSFSLTPMTYNDDESSNYEEEHEERELLRSMKPRPKDFGRLTVTDSSDSRESSSDYLDQTPTASEVSSSSDISDIEGTSTLCAPRPSLDPLEQLEQLPVYADGDSFSDDDEDDNTINVIENENVLDSPLLEDIQLDCVLETPTTDSCDSLDSIEIVANQSVVLPLTSSKDNIVLGSNLQTGASQKIQTNEQQLPTIDSEMMLSLQVDTDRKSLTELDADTVPLPLLDNDIKPVAQSGIETNLLPNINTDTTPLQHVHEDAERNVLPQSDADTEPSQIDTDTDLSPQTERDTALLPKFNINTNPLPQVNAETMSLLHVDAKMNTLPQVEAELKTSHTASTRTSDGSIVETDHDLDVDIDSKPSDPTTETSPVLQPSCLEFPLPDMSMHEAMNNNIVISNKNALQSPGYCMETNMQFTDSIENDFPPPPPPSPPHSLVDEDFPPPPPEILYQMAATEGSIEQYRHMLRNAESDSEESDDDGDADTEPESDSEGSVDLDTLLFAHGISVMSSPGDEFGAGLGGTYRMVEPESKRWSCPPTFGRKEKDGSISRSSSGVKGSLECSSSGLLVSSGQSAPLSLPPEKINNKLPTERPHDRPPPVPPHAKPLQPVPIYAKPPHPHTKSKSHTAADESHPPPPILPKPQRSTKSGGSEPPSLPPPILPKPVKPARSSSSHPHYAEIQKPMVTSETQTSAHFRRSTSIDGKAPLAETDSL